MAQALIHIGHILGVALAVGSLFLIHYAVLPAGAESLEDRRIPFLMALRRRTHVITLTAVVLIFLTGLLKMTPVSMGFGGVSPLGAGGKYTAVLHAKIILGLAALIIATLAARPTDDPDLAAKRTRMTKISLHMALLVIVLAVMHSTRALGV